METLTAAEARRAAVAAQGFTGKARRHARPLPSRRRLLALVDHLGMLQIDSVAAVVRSHYLPAYSRLGTYRQADLDLLSWTRGPSGRVLFESWAHEASLLPVRFEPLLRWRQRVVEEEAIVGTKKNWFATRQRSELLDAVLGEIRERGPLAASELSHHDPDHRRTGSWWSWGKVKAACEYLFATGRVHVADRRGFERRYDIPERVLPADIRAVPTPDEDVARRALLVHAADALGVATVNDLADYFRMKKRITAARVSELTRSGDLVEVGVEGWRDPAYVRPSVDIPSRVSARALLSPFDSLVFCRPRSERLFDFRYRIEIYTPEPKRVFGYYVLPFLLGDRLAARVDVRADRTAGVLRVPGAFTEPGHRPDGVAEPLAGELHLLAHWLGLGTVEMGNRGDLADPLRSALTG